MIYCSKLFKKSKFVMQLKKLFNLCFLPKKKLINNALKSSSSKINASLISPIYLNAFSSVINAKCLYRCLVWQ
jgi:hypothetical protein